LLTARLPFPRFAQQDLAPVTPSHDALAVEITSRRGGVHRSSSWWPGGSPPYGPWECRSSSCRAFLPIRLRSADPFGYQCCPWWSFLFQLRFQPARGLTLGTAEAAAGPVKHRLPLRNSRQGAAISFSPGAWPPPRLPV